METATFAAGCFWGVEEVLRKVKGVASTRVGYCGGRVDNPTYETVCSGQTGHAEAVEVLFDEAVVSFEELLTVFWNCHDPTTKDRQGPDRGTQYRSVVFYHTPAQQSAAVEAKARLQQGGRFKDPIVTEIVPAGPFYRAEEYHQRYLQKQGRGHC